MRRIGLIFVAMFLVGCAAHPMSYMGEKYVGAPYKSDPLGEGVGYDVDPLIREDAFDCVTFVETVLAGGDVNSLNRIRYRDGIVVFENRNHFIETDWLTNNASRVENVSRNYGKVVVRNVTINKSAWFWRVHNMNVAAAPVSVALEYVPYSDLVRPENTDVLIVLFITGNSKKSDIIGTDLAVVHMGLLVPNGVMRHASSDMGWVVDVDFMEYAAARAKNKNNLGVMFVGIK